MKKVKCYPNYACLASLFLFLISSLCLVLPFTIFEGESDTDKSTVIFVIVLTFCMVFSAWGFFYHIQYLHIKDNKLILKNLFFTLKVLDINDCYYEIATLNGNYGRIYVAEKWICIYSNDETNRFRSGYTNGKKFNRIQLIYNKKNFDFVDNYVKKRRYDNIT